MNNNDSERYFLIKSPKDDKQTQLKPKENKD